MSRAKYPYGYFADPETMEPIPDVLPVVEARWLANGRDMVLLQDVLFVTPDGRSWRAYAGDIVNGQSIPRFFWRFVGSPFTGRARDASVVHDVSPMYDKRTHWMFWCAMRARGNGFWNSLLKWLAVYFWNITLRQG